MSHFLSPDTYGCIGFLINDVIDQGELMKKYFTIQETADLLGVSERTVYRWIKNGELRYIKILNTIRIPETAVNRRNQRLIKKISNQKKDRQ